MENLPENGFLFSAIRFVLMHSVGDMAAMQEKSNIKLRKGGCNLQPLRMSRAIASSLPPTLSFLQRLISRPLLVDTQLATALAGMKGPPHRYLKPWQIASKNCMLHSPSSPGGVVLYSARNNPFFPSYSLSDEYLCVASASLRVQYCFRVVPLFVPVGFIIASASFR